MVNPFEETLQAGTIDPREQYIMQQSMFNQPEEPTYSIGDSYQGDQSGIMNWALTPAKWFHENVGGRINADVPYYNPPGGKTTSMLKVGDTPVSAVNVFKNLIRTGGQPQHLSFNLGSLLSSPFTGMGIDAALRDFGDDESKAYWAGQPYQQRVEEAGIPYNALPSSTFAPDMSRYENTLGFDVNLGDIVNQYVPGMSLPGDLNLSYDYDLDDESSLLKLLYNLKF